MQPPMSQNTRDFFSVYFVQRTVPFVSQHSQSSCVIGHYKQSEVLTWMFICTDIYLLRIIQMCKMNVETCSCGCVAFLSILSAHLSQKWKSKTNENITSLLFFILLLLCVCHVAMFLPHGESFSLFYIIITVPAEKGKVTQELFKCKMSFICL